MVVTPFSMNSLAATSVKPRRTKAAFNGLSFQLFGPIGIGSMLSIASPIVANLRTGSRYNALSGVPDVFVITMEYRRNEQSFSHSETKMSINWIAVRDKRRLRCHSRNTPSCVVHMVSKAKVIGSYKLKESYHKEKNQPKKKRISTKVRLLKIMIIPI